MTVDIEEIVAIALENQASDVHFKVGMPPVLRIDGQLSVLGDLPVLEDKPLAEAIMGLLDERQQKLFRENMELDVALNYADCARVRLNIYYDMESIGCAMRIVPFEIPTLEHLYMPPVVERLSKLRSGLVLVAGATGAGKSTLLASMIDSINRRDSVHIYTIEDPIEFVHRPVRSIITQREVGVNTKSFATALRSALRADPNVLLLGELRDRETVVEALKAAETGLLVLSTLHTSSVVKTIQRLLGMFEPSDQSAVRMQIAYCLRGVICQQLVPTIEKGRRALQEIMINTEAVQEAILFGELDKLTEYIQNGSHVGMQLMDDAVLQAYQQGSISSESASQFALNRDDMERAMRGATV